MWRNQRISVEIPQKTKNKTTIIVSYTHWVYTQKNLICPPQRYLHISAYCCSTHNSQDNGSNLEAH